MAGIIEGAGMGPSRAMATNGYLFGTSEVANVHVHDDGKVTVYVGTHSHGQSHDITFRQIAADSLQVKIEDICLVQGDTDLGPGVFGTGAARSLSTAGMAIVEASKRVIAKATRLAAHLLECDEVDLEYRDGAFIVRGTDKKLSFESVAEMAYYGANYPTEGFELGLNEMVFYDPSHFNYPTALHLAVVIVDEDTGVVTLRDYYCIDDCGRVINPMVVHGQVHGGLGQGIGQAMFEQIVYDPKTGQLLSGSFMDYVIPRADLLPSFHLDFQETLNPHNALGVKGCSESGVCGAPAAIGNAIVDALWDLGVRQVTLPYTAEKVWKLIELAKRNHISSIPM
jgi:carbon-monoxide dehydrogenase large subunit